MPVLMMRIRIMRMRMRMRIRQRRVLVRMAVPRAGQHSLVVRMAVVVVAHAVGVHMVMGLRRVGMRVRVPLGQGQHHAQRHQRARQQQGATGSPSKPTASSAPQNGATEKYAPVRAVPRWRSATTNKVKPTP